MSTKTSSVRISHPPHSSRKQFKPLPSSSLSERIFQMALKTVIRERYLEERFDDSSKQSEAQAAVKRMVLLAKKGLGGRELIEPRKQRYCLCHR